MTLPRCGLIALIAMLLSPVSAQAQDGEWLVAPYLWSSDVGWDLASRGSGTIEFRDLLDKVDGAGLIRIEFIRDKFGATFDYVGMSLSDNRRITIPGPVPIDVTTRAGLDLTLFEGGFVYRPQGGDSGFDAIIGLRYTDTDSNLVVTPGMTQPQRFDTGDSFSDFFVGARYLQRINESWDWSVRGDYGAGGSDGALNLMAQVGWRSAGNIGVSLAYRHLEFDFDQRVEGEAATSEFSFSGPALGFLVRF